MGTEFVKQSNDSKSNLENVDISAATAPSSKNENTSQQPAVSLSQEARILMLSKAGGRPKTAPATESATNSSQTDGNQEQSKPVLPAPAKPSGRESTRRNIFSCRASTTRK